MFKPKRLVIFLVVIFILISCLIAFLKKQYVAPILMYHSVTLKARPENRLAVTVDAFQRQMQFLKKHRYNVLPLENLVDYIRQKRKIPGRTVAITFDDGYKDNYIYAFPILKRYGLCATIFIIVDEVGRPDRLSWQELKTMQDSGIIVFGSHTLTHKYLEEIKSEEELRKEIFDSKRILEEKFGRTITAFSYPTGKFTPVMKQMVMDAGYKFAVTTSPGRKFSKDDIFALKRLRISATSDNLFVFWFKTTGFYTFIKEHRDED